MKADRNLAIFEFDDGKNIYGVPLSSVVFYSFNHYSKAGCISLKNGESLFLSNDQFEEFVERFMDFHTTSIIISEEG